MLELFGCVLLIIQGISFILMIIDELRTNYKLRKDINKNDV